MTQSTAQLLGELALARALAYLRWSGVEFTERIYLDVLRLVESALSQGTDDLIERVMAALETQFDLKPASLPCIAPALRRGSVGYDSY